MYASFIEINDTVVLAYFCLYLVFDSNILNRDHLSIN